MYMLTERPSSERKLKKEPKINDPILRGVLRGKLNIPGVSFCGPCLHKTEQPQSGLAGIMVVLTCQMKTGFVKVCSRFCSKRGGVCKNEPTAVQHRPQASGMFFTGGEN